MRTNKYLLVVAAGLTAWLIVVWLSTSIQGVGKTYELRPEITLPEYKTDTARVIDAYERMMARFMSLAERNLAGINTDVRDIARKLDSIDRKLTVLSTRMTRIEKALGIEQPQKPVKKPPKAKAHDHTNKLSSEGRK